MSKTRILTILFLTISFAFTACSATTPPAILTPEAQDSTQQETTPPARFSPTETPSTILFELPKFKLTNLEQKQTETSWEISGTIEQWEPKWQELKIGGWFYSRTKSGDIVPHMGGVLIVFCNREGRNITYLGADTSYVKEQVDTWSFVLRISSDGNMPDYTYLWHPTMGSYLSFEGFRQEAQISQIFVSLDDDDKSVPYGDNQYMRQFEVDLSDSPDYQPPSITLPALSGANPSFAVTEMTITRSTTSLTVTGEIKQIEPTWQGLPETEAIRVGSLSIWFCKPDGSPIIAYHGSELLGFAVDRLEPEVIMDSGTFSIQLSEGKYGPKFCEGAFMNMSFSDFMRSAIIYKVLVDTNGIQLGNDYVSQFEADLANALIEDRSR